jgi:hypothetical protein
MEVFLQWGESRGCTREEMISFYDSEGNVPLHSAVHGGDIKVKLYRLVKYMCDREEFHYLSFFLPFLVRPLIFMLQENVA